MSAKAEAIRARARSGVEIARLTFRQRYNANPSQQNGYPDIEPNRAWGVNEWATRAGQGAYLDWVVANSLLDDNDLDQNPTHEGTIQQVDRTTVTEIAEISSAFTELQSILDNADAGLNPLGLATDVVPFGLNPSDIEAGKTHFDQILERAVKALRNAHFVFKVANENTRRLRAVQDQATAFDDTIDEQELDFKGRLVEIFGRPYPDDIGPGGTYPVGYDGPDLFHFDYIDPSPLLGLDSLEVSGNTVTVVTPFTIPIVSIDPNGTNNEWANLPWDCNVPGNTGNGSVCFETINVEFNLSTDGIGLIKPAGWLSTRLEPGQVQVARSELLQALGRYLQLLTEFEAHIEAIDLQSLRVEQVTGINQESLQIVIAGQEGTEALQNQIFAASISATALRQLGSITRELVEAGGHSIPQILIAGLAAGTDAPGRAASGAFLAAGKVTAQAFDIAADAADLSSLRFSQLIQRGGRRI